jgi:ABC-type sugar transport system permease subunit
LKTLFFRLQHRYAPYIFVAPFVILFLTFTLYPLVKSILLSFYITNGPQSQVFVGLANFRFLWTDPAFHKAVWNTCLYAFCSVFLQLPASLGLAMLLNSALVRGRNFFRFAFFSPHLVGQVFVAVLFSVIFIPKFGLLNRVLHFLFEVPVDIKWLGNPNLVMPAMVLTSLWMYVGFNMIYFLAALQAVDRELYEASMVDGAGPFRQFLHITLPGIRSVAVFVIVLSTIGSFQLFELPYVMLNNTAGPDDAGLTVVMYLYQNGFVSGDLGYASAIGWSLAFGVLLISLIQMRLSGTWKTED